MTEFKGLVGGKLVTFEVVSQEELTKKQEDLILMRENE